MNVKLKIPNPDLRSFIRYLFSAPHTGNLIVSRNNDLGLFLCATVSYRNIPDKRDGEDIVELRLPISPSTSSGMRKYCYFTGESEAKINDFLAALLKTDFDRYWISGQTSGMKRKEIIESYLLARGLFEFNADTKNKRGYRIELKNFESQIKRFYDRAHHIDKKIEKEQDFFKKSFII